MHPNVFALASLSVHDALCKSYGDDVSMHLHMLKMLEYASMIELEIDEELPVAVLRNIKEMSKDSARFIVSVRNSKIVSQLTISEERFIYKTLRKILMYG